jgi:hypothetical protein
VRRDPICSTGSLAARLKWVQVQSVAAVPADLRPMLANISSIDFFARLPESESRLIQAGPDCHTPHVVDAPAAATAVKVGARDSRAGWANVRPRAGFLPHRPELWAITAGLSRLNALLALAGWRHVPRPSVG